MCNKNEPYLKDLISQKSRIQSLIIIKPQLNLMTTIDIDVPIEIKFVILFIIFNMNI